MTGMRNHSALEDPGNYGVEGYNSEPASDEVVAAEPGTDDWWLASVMGLLRRFRKGENSNIGLPKAILPVRRNYFLRVLRWPSLFFLGLGFANPFLYRVFLPAFLGSPPAAMSRSR